MARKTSPRQAGESVVEDSDAALRPAFDFARSAFENSLQVSRTWAQGWATWCGAAPAPDWPSQWAAQASLVGAQSVLASVEQARTLMDAIARAWAPSVYDTSLPD